MLDLTPLGNANRLLLDIRLKPVQGERFQPTGFPSLGAATYRSQAGETLLVESSQSMANRLETTCWDATNNKPVAALNGISHITVTRKGKFLTDSILESHRINSPYLLEGADRKFADNLKAELGGLDEGPIDRRKFTKVLLKYDVGSLLHGVFLAKKELAGGRLRIARALSAFIEAKGAAVAASGGVKNDHVNPSGDTKSGFGNVPFARDEYVASEIHLYVNLDLAQIRGYGLGETVERLLILLALYRVRKLLDGDLRLRTACDLEPIEADDIKATRPAGFSLPSLKDLESSLQKAIADCKDEKGAPLMVQTTVVFDDELKKGKDSPDGVGATDDVSDSDESN